MGALHRWAFRRVDNGAALSTIVDIPISGTVDNRCACFPPYEVAAVGTSV